MNPISRLLRRLRAAAGIVVAGLVGELPGPPPQDGPPPDIDGRRQGEADTTEMSVRVQEKEGKGGFR